MIMKLWIARDEGINGDICLFNKEPYQDMVGVWTCENYDYIVLERSEFPEVTFENSQQEVEIKLVNEIVGVAESPSKTFPRVNVFETGASYRR